MELESFAFAWISIPQRCDWRQALRSDNEQIFSNFNTSKVRLEVDDEDNAATNNINFNTSKVRLEAHLSDQKLGLERR